ncbi:MAG: hypothetical protein ACYDEX_22760 [Mobilitalea sp.]
MKWIILAYLGFNLTFILMSTLMVGMGVRPAMDYIRILVIFRIPFQMPQLIDHIEVTPWLTHVSYRLYSMMITTTILGLLLALIYKPRTWCTICPIATVSDVLLKK